MNDKIPDQTLLLVNENDEFSGQYEHRWVCHTGKGVHHRAFVVCLFNDKDEILLQKRRHMLWDGYWDVTAISHPLHLADHDESYKEAGFRSLRIEMGIDNMKLKKIGGFNYFAKHGKNCENEYCAVLVGDYAGKVRANPDAVYAYKWMKKEEFISDCEKHPELYAPWTILTSETLRQKPIA